MITVALPVWNSKKIAWAAMESLCRQEAAPTWELIVSEEQIGSFCGREFFQSFLPRLNEVGCVQLTYIALYEWQPLSVKWKRIAEHADEKSDLYILMAADCYAHPFRLAMTRHEMDKGPFDWYHETKGFFFDVKGKTLIRYNHSLLQANVCQTALNMATRTAYVKALPEEAVRRGVDGWMYKNILYAKDGALKVVINDGDFCGVDTHGLNNISINRQMYFENPQPPFESTTIELAAIVPPEIKDRLWAQ